MLRPDPEIERLWDGVSVYATEDQARQQALSRPKLGTVIAELAIPADGSIPFRRTARASGHHTLWGDPALLRACVIRITNV